MKNTSRHSKNSLIVAVVGGSRCSAEVERISQKIGFLLGKMGAIVVCGGLGGVMEAVAKGVKRAKGICIGFLPGINKEDANHYLTIALPTGLGFARNTLVVGCADVVIAMPGKFGTLSEIAFAMNMKKPVIGIGRPRDIEGVIQADTPKEAVERISRLRKFKKI